MDSIKVLQVIDTLDVGGAERVFVDICNILHGNDIKVSAMFLLKAGVLNNDLSSSIEIFEMQRKNKWDLSTMYKCSKILNEYDIVHCHFRHVYKYISLVSKFFCVKSRIILHNHGIYNSDNKGLFLFATFFKPKYYIGVSTTLTDWAKIKLKIEKKRVFILENIIVKRKNVHNINKELDMLLVSNIKPSKNNIFAVELAKRMGSDILLIGKNQDNNYFRFVEEYANNIPFPKIEILENITNAQDFILKSKFGLHTSKSETGPLVLIEYLAYGLPFLSFDTGEVSRIVKPYFPEFFIDNFEINDWVDRIKLIQSKSIEKEKIIEVFEKHFGTDQYFKKIIDIYLCILKN